MCKFREEVYQRARSRSKTINTNKRTLNMFAAYFLWAAVIVPTISITIVSTAGHKDCVANRSFSVVTPNAYLSSLSSPSSSSLTSSSLLLSSTSVPSSLQVQLTMLEHEQHHSMLIDRQLSKKKKKKKPKGKKKYYYNKPQTEQSLIDERPRQSPLTQTPSSPQLSIQSFTDLGFPLLSNQTTNITIRAAASTTIEPILRQRHKEDDEESRVAALLDIRLGSMVTSGINRAEADDENHDTKQHVVDVDELGDHMIESRFPFSSTFAHHRHPHQHVEVPSALTPTSSTSMSSTYTILTRKRRKAEKDIGKAIGSIVFSSLSLS